MHAAHVFKVIDAHAGGARTRMVFSGIPRLAGASVMDKMQYFAADHDWIRRSLVLEPRGGGLTSAVVLVPPAHPDADIGAFFMEAHGYLPMCGSDTICAVTAMIETGQIAATGSRTPVRIDTAAGLIEATAELEGDRVAGVTFLGAPAFRSLADYSLPVPGSGTCGSMSRTAATSTSSPTPPNSGSGSRPTAPVRPSRSRPTRVMVVMPPGIVDRSPCGTGTTAKIATLRAAGHLGLGRPFVHQSVTGATFTGWAVEDTTAGALPACRVAITGTAHVIADSAIYVDRADAPAHGFQLS